MSGLMMKRKCCGSACSMNCQDWCDCLPSTVTLSVGLYQKWEQFVDGNLKDWGEAELNLHNVKLDKYADAQDCFLYARGVVNGTPNGTWDFRQYTETYTAPLLSFYITPNCPANGCKTFSLATTEERTGGGNIDTSEVFIECYDPCQQPLGLPAVYPTNRIVIDILGNVTTDFNCYGEYLNIVCGANYPPTTQVEELQAEIYGKPDQCLNTGTFAQRTLKWFNAYGNVYPHYNSYACQGLCSGGCKGPYTCLDKEGNGTPPYLPQYDYWTRYDAQTCTVTSCWDTHSCWNGFYGNQPAVYGCSCNNSWESGMGDSYIKHYMTHTLTLTIP